MKAVFLVLLSLMCAASAQGEGNVEVDMAPVYEFAQEYDAQNQVRNVYEEALSGEGNAVEATIAYLREQAQEPLRKTLRMCAVLLPVVLLSALMSGMFPEGNGGCGAALFLLRLSLLLGFADLASAALDSIQSCVGAVKELTDRTAPAMTALLAAIGMEGSVSLISPAAVMIGNVAEGLFLDYGLPLCKAALCTAIAGNLSPQINLRRFTRLFRRAVNWGAGVATTVFTAFLTLQGTVSEGLDGIAARTAKFAVDSAAPVIGSGISDAWDSYLSGVLVTKNAVGLSGIATLLFAGARPVLICLAAMAALYLIAALLDAFGEKSSAAAAEQIAGICQMALSLCTATLAMAMILLGAAMMIGKGLRG